MKENLSSYPSNSPASLNIDNIIAQLHKKQLLVVNPRRKNGIILYKRYHAEFAGPGAVIGSVFDLDVVQVIPVGKLSLVTPQTPQEKINAYLIRRQWVRLTKQITDNPVPLQRAQVILNQFENWFDADTAAKLPDEAFALLVGVLPQTIKKIRHEFERL
ncbi:hypothetical protein [Gloeothece verrucosa]|uniref:Uncharacterized protein n=1 Tax=Gloeothece verrucosa (strain PCC 7822) TaxID=497965 RepID=E0U5X4_GLOV7|nr:hypothetical protein [Gloeothece verrucosa]ADN17083.1 conserved hypothetical protein [Gloeothece verrucosa PCC 7822]